VSACGYYYCYADSYRIISYMFKHNVTSFTHAQHKLVIKLII